MNKFVAKMKELVAKVKGYIPKVKTYLPKIKAYLPILKQYIANNKILKTLFTQRVGIPLLCIAVLVGINILNNTPTQPPVTNKAKIITNIKKDKGKKDVTKKQEEPVTPPQEQVQKPTQPTAPPAPVKRQAVNGVYTVVKGDTLGSIAKEFGVNYLELADWNNIANPASISVGQKINVVKPANWQPKPKQPVATPQKPIQRTVPAPRPTQPSQPVNPTPQPVPQAPSHSISAFEQQVVTLTNQQRVNNGLRPLAVDGTLSKMARDKSYDMSVNNYFSHTSPTYGSPFDMMKRYGISYGYAGENIAMGYTSPEAVVDAWMNSQGHRENILNPHYTHIGVGYVAEGNYWTQEFISK